MPTTQQARAFQVQISSSESVTIKIQEPELWADQLSLTTWTASFVLANQLHKFNIDIPTNASVPFLEIGAGTGLVGLTAALIWKRPVILTDLEPIVPGLAGNININSSLLDKVNHMTCGTLDWTRPEFLQLQSGDVLSAESDKASVILAADTIYSDDHPVMLSTVILKWLAQGPDSRVIFTYPLRVAYLDYIREVWELLEAAGLEVIEEGRQQETIEEWDDERLCEWCIWKWKS